MEGLGLLYVNMTPTSWCEARGFCLDQAADLVVTSDLTDLTNLIDELYEFGILSKMILCIHTVLPNKFTRYIPTYILKNLQVYYFFTLIVYSICGCKRNVPIKSASKMYPAKSVQSITLPAVAPHVRREGVTVREAATHSS